MQGAEVKAPYKCLGAVGASQHPCSRAPGPLVVPPRDARTQRGETRGRATGSPATCPPAPPCLAIWPFAGSIALSPPPQPYPLPWFQANSSPFTLLTASVHQPLAQACPHLPSCHPGQGSARQSVPKSHFCQETCSPGHPGANPSWTRLTSRTDARTAVPDAAKLPMVPHHDPSRAPSKAPILARAPHGAGSALLWAPKIPPGLSRLAHYGKLPFPACGLVGFTHVPKPPRIPKP